MLLTSFMLLAIWLAGKYYISLRSRMALALGETTRRVSTPLLLATVAGVIALLLPNAAESRVLLTLDDFGAVGDGIANDTQAFVDAWKAACATDDHTFLNVPAGKSYQIWPVTLTGPCRDEIKLFISGNIIAPESPDDWEDSDRSQWLHFYRVRDLSVSGGGIIDGRGQQWWAQSCKGNLNTTEDCTSDVAPKALHFEDCQDISVQGITLQNSQSYHLTFTRCSNVKANYLRVTSPEDSPDTTGVHLVSSYNVHIMDDLISTGDDCVSIVGNCTDVRLRAISCGPGHGISIGGFGENQTFHRVEKIKMDTLFISNSANGVRVKTWQNGCGVARKVKFGNILMKNVSNPIIIDQYYSNRGIPCRTRTGSAVAVEKINYIDITGTSASERAVTFSCSDILPCKRLSLKNVNLTRVGGQNASAYCHRAFGKSIGVVIPESCLGKEDFIQQIPSTGMQLGDAAAAAAEEEDDEEDADW